MIEIRINGESIDLNEGTGFEQSFQSFDISSLSTSKSDSTSSITVPRTARNDKMFGIQGGSNNNDTFRRGRIRCDILNNGTYVMSNATCIVQDYNLEGIRFNAFKGAIDLFSLMQDANLIDLDWSQFDHYRNFNTILAKRNALSGIVYAFIDFGAMLYTERSFDTRFTLPSIHVKDMLSLIMEKQGFTLSGRILNDDVFNDLVIPLSTINAGPGSDSSLTVARSQLSPSSVYTGDDFTSPTYVFAQCSFDFNGTDVIPCFQTHTFLGIFLPGAILSNPTVTNGAYFVRSNGLYRFTATVTVTATNVDPLNPCRLKIFVDKTIATSTTGNRLISKNVAISNGTATYTLVSDFETLSIGDALAAVVEIPITTANPQETISILLASFTCDEVMDTNHVFNSVYDVGNNMPDMSQLAFIKGIFSMFQLIPIVNAETGNILLWSYREAYLDSGSAIDWSDRLDTSLSISRSPRLPGFSKVNLLKYDNPDGSDYGSGIIEGLDYGYPSRQELVVLPFSTPISTANAMNGLIPAIAYIPVFDPTQLNGYLAYTENPEGVRILLLKRLASIDQVTFNDVTTGSSSGVTTNVSYAYFFFDRADHQSLGFADSSATTGLISMYYDGVVQLLDNSEMITCSMLLTSNDIVNLDFSKPVYIREFGAKFIINKINGYQAGRSCQVELIRM